MINHKYKFIFIHFPSTGGTSIESALSDGSEEFSISHVECPINLGEFYEAFEQKHISPTTSKKIYANYWDEYFKFTFVRNPFDWLRSLWLKGRRRRGVLSFQKWLLNPTLAPHEDQSILKLESQLQEMDFIGRFENLQKDFDVICDAIKAPKKPLPHLYGSKKKDYKQFYNDKSRKVVEDLFSEYMEYFHYFFD